MVRLVASIFCLGAATSMVHCGTSSSTKPGLDAGNSGGDEAGAGGAHPGSGGAEAKGGTTSAGGGAATGGAGGSAATGGASSLARCDALVLAGSVQDAGRDADRFTWQDARCEPRVASLVRTHNGYLRQFTYRVDGADRVCTGTGVNGWDGFGYAVSHYADTASISKSATPGSFGPVFTGRHHAIYEYKFTMGFNGPTVPVTVHWMFATGRDHPIYAITYDLSAHPANTIGGDTRSPYGDMFWEGETSQPTTIAGVGWGDRYKFVTTTTPLSLDSEWDYTKPNTVPYAFEWATSPDAEMGLVQTEPYERHDGGGYWNYANWGKTSATQTRLTQQTGAMPNTWNWTYQLNQYELCEPASCVGNPTSSHRLAWGANYGALGGDGKGAPGTYNAYGDDRRISGHPYQSYAVFVVFGKHSTGTVARQVEAAESLANVTLAARTGAVTTRVPAGVGRTDTLASQPPGYDARYASWFASMSGGALDLTVDVSAGRVAAPVLAVAGYDKAAPPTVTIDGRKSEADRDFYASVDTAKKTLWLTFPGGWAGKQTIIVR